MPVAFGFTLDNLGITGANPATAPYVPPAADSTTGGGGATSSGDGYQGARGHDETIMQASVNNEAAALQGGYNPTVENAVSASRGVGASEADVRSAAAEYARLADTAVREGRPASSIRYDDPNLSQAAKDAMYAEAAQQNGTTPEAIEQASQQRQQQEMQALQQGVLGGAVAGAGLTGALDSLTGQGQQAPQRAQTQAPQAAANPFGISSDVLNMLRGSMVDMGSTTAALAGGQFSPTATPGMDQRERSGPVIS